MTISNYEKMDDNGNFQPYNGITVVSHTIENEKIHWNSLYVSLNKCYRVNELVALLPPESYHMTLVGLSTEEKVAGKWMEFVDNQLSLMYKISDFLNQKQIRPIVTVSGVDFTKVLVVNFKLEPECQAAINSFAKEFNLEKNLPKHGFHLTLGYVRGKSIEKDDLFRIKSFVEEKLRKSFEKISFDAANLCYFKSMSHFEPWDGIKNPWS
jgi:hypothetical protein